VSMGRNLLAPATACRVAELGSGAFRPPA
jgi:hypothetical protein